MTYIPDTSVTGTQLPRVDRYLDTNGDGTGTVHAIGDYSVAPTSFFIQPPPGQIFRIVRMLVYIEDSGSFDSGRYGNNIILVNGITVQSLIDSQPHVLSAQLPVLINSHWNRLCYDFTVSSYGAGNETATGRWTFRKAGQSVRLIGDNNDRLEVILNDDFTGLADHTFLVQGYIE